MKTSFLVLMRSSLPCMILAAGLLLGSPRGTYGQQVDPMLGGDMAMPPGGARGGPSSAGRSNADQLRQLQTKLSEEQKALDAIETELRQDFEKQPEWQDAQAAQQQAQSEYDSARQAVLSKVYETPQYKEMLDKKFAAETELQNLTAGSDVPPEKLQAASTAVLNATNAIRKMEDDALSADSTVVEAKQKLSDADGKLNDLKKKFKESLELNPRYLTQSDRVEDAKFKLADARQKNAAAAQQRSNANRRSNEPRRQSTPSRHRSSGGGGGAY